MPILFKVKCRIFKASKYLCRSHGNNVYITIRLIKSHTCGSIYIALLYLIKGIMGIFCHNIKPITATLSILNSFNPIVSMAVFSAFCLNINCGLIILSASTVLFVFLLVLSDCLFQLETTTVSAETLPPGKIGFSFFVMPAASSSLFPTCSRMWSFASKIFSIKSSGVGSWGT